MKKFLVFCLTLPLFLANISSVCAQGDIVTVKASNFNGNTCAFNVTVSNHNSAGKNIDEIKLDITSLTPSVSFYDFTIPLHWNSTISGNQLEADGISDNGGIAPNGTVGGFIFSYSGGNDQFDNPVTISWTTRSSGADVSTGTMQTICTQFQQYLTLDTCTVIPSQSGADPCFTFTMINRNNQGLNSNATIWNVSFQLENLTGGTLRPSKIFPANGWSLDSVTTYTAYFHTDNNPINPGSAVGGWIVCLRGNPNINKFNFVWSASDEQNSLIDRDTIFNISNTATGSLTDADSVSAKAANGCLYNVTLKNYHVSNLLPPSPIVKFVITSKTTGIAFSAAPSAPPNWTKTVTPSSIIYAADSANHGIPGGIVSANQFSFSVNGPTTAGFDIGWETDRAGSPYPPNTSILTTGTMHLSCTVATPATDSASIASGNTECTFDLSVKNAHNIKPESNLSQITISIPSGSGTLSPTGTSGSSGVWNFSNISATQIAYKAPTSGDALVSNDVLHLLFTFTPKTPGTNVAATWSTFDDAAITSGTPVSTGNVTINCTPIVTICDTTTRTASLSNDSCTKTLTLNNRKTTDILSLVLTVTNGWKIDTASTPPSGWTKQVGGSGTFITYTSANGLAAGQSQDFTLKFSGYFSQPVDTFTIVAVSTDRNNVVCTSVDSEISCIAHTVITGSVQPHSDNIGVTNFTIQPNPTRGSADISFELNTPERVVIIVFDVLGHQTGIVTSKIMSEGTYSLPYSMNSLPDGTYYVRMQTPLGVMTRKLVLTK